MKDTKIGSPLHLHPIVCVHGTGGNGAQWQPLIDRLAKAGFEASAPNLRYRVGADGIVDPRLSGTTLDDYAEDVTVEISRLGDVKPILLLFSLGVPIGYKVIEKYGDRIQGVLLAAPASTGFLSFAATIEIVKHFFRYFLPMLFGYGTVRYKRSTVKKLFFSGDDSALTNSIAAQPESGKALQQMAFTWLKAPNIAKDRVVVVAAREDALQSHKAKKKWARKLGLQFQTISSSHNALPADPEFAKLVIGQIRRLSSLDD